MDNEKLRHEHVELIEENNGLRAQNQKLSEESSYAKELASAAAVELKNLAEEVTKLSLQNERQAKELLVAQERAYSRASHNQANNGPLRRYTENKFDGIKSGRRGRSFSRGSDGISTVHDDAENWNLDPDDLRMELHARKQKEATLEAALAEKEFARRGAAKEY